MRSAALSLAAVLAMACSSQGPGGPLATVPTIGESVDETPTPYAGPARGTWSGTITARATINETETEEGSSGDPGSTYYETFVRRDTTQTDITDTFTISASDPEDLTYGIHGVELGGTVSAAGSTLERYVTTWQKQNSGCTWTEETGTELSGSWTETARAVGEIRFSEDGEYSIDIRANNSGPDGEAPPGPQLPYRNFKAISNLSAGCEGDGFDTTTTQGPGIVFATEFLGETTDDGLYSRIEGQLNSANPGSVVDGQKTWNLAFPEGMTLTITWRLERSGPIVLPHS